MGGIAHNATVHDSDAANSSNDSITNVPLDLGELDREYLEEVVGVKIADVAETRRKRVVIPTAKRAEADREREAKLKKKFNVREVRVFLTRLDFSGVEQRQQRHFAKTKKLKYVFSRKKENRRKPKRRRAPSAPKTKYKSSPLQDANPRVVLKRLDVEHDFCPKKGIDAKDARHNMEPRVMLKRLDMDSLKDLKVTSILDNVPGLHDTQMMRPSAVDNVVQVVQIAGGRSGATVQATNNQTSTQVGFYTLFFI